MLSAIKPWQELTSSLIIDSTNASTALMSALFDQSDPQSLTTANERARALLRPRNRALDRLFYNVAPKDEQQVLARESNPQGAVIVVKPDPTQPLVFFTDVAGLLADDLHTQVDALSVAGLGSSSVGAVGLARDVANGTGLPVAAIVSGYGLEDLMFEAIGGAFTLRGVNQIEFFFEQMRHSLTGLSSVPGLLPNIEDYDSSGAGPALGAAKSLLRSARLPKLRWAVGHSKGNLVISGAIAELVCEDADYELHDVNIVLFGAVTALPPRVGRQYQFIGALDAFGKLNSRLDVKHREVAGAMHHLNTTLPFAMNAVEQLQSVHPKVQTGGPRRVRPKAPALSDQIPALNRARPGVAAAPLTYAAAGCSFPARSPAQARIAPQSRMSLAGIRLNGVRVNGNRSFAGSNRPPNNLIIDGS
jgi:hypothetical protein